MKKSKNISLQPQGAKQPAKKATGQSTGFQVENRFIQPKFNFNNQSYSYGSDDKLPQQMVEMLYNSPNAIMAMKKRASYIASNGFTDDVINKKICNPATGLTFAGLLAKKSVEQCVFGARAYLIGRDLGGKIISVEDIEFELCRDRGTHITYNPSLGTSNYSLNKEIKHPKFGGKVIDLKLHNENLTKYEQRGEIAYLFSKNPFSRLISLPDWFSGEWSIRTDAEIQLMGYEQAINALTTSGMVVIYGDQDDITVDPASGLTKWGSIKQVLQRFTGRIKDSITGLSERYKFGILNVSSKEDAPEFIPFQNDKVIESGITFAENIARNVIRLFRVHPVLCNFSDAAILGNRSAMAMASEELAKDVIPDQNEITADMLLFFDGDFTITKFNPIQFIPAEFMNVITLEEKRAMLGLTTDEATKQELTNNNTTA